MVERHPMTGAVADRLPDDVVAARPYADWHPAFADVQARLRPGRSARYDFVVCGAGAAGSVVAARLAEAGAKVLLLEAGGTDDLPEVADPGLWVKNLGSERVWPFQSEPDPAFNGRSLEMNMGRVLGGGSSVNPALWLRGHRTDWERLAGLAGSADWGYAAMLDVYRRIENWRGQPDASRRGATGPMEVRPAPDPSPLAPAFLAAARATGAAGYPSINGEMMETEGGCSATELILDGQGRRRTPFRAYAYPLLAQGDLTMVSDAVVTRVVVEDGAAVAVECRIDGEDARFDASREVILCAGAVQTPKILMQSGIGDREELARHGIPSVSHLPGVGQNFRNHVACDVIHAYREPVERRNSGAEALMMWRSRDDLLGPDLMVVAVEAARASPELMKRTQVDGPCWGLKLIMLCPESVGRIRLSGPGAEHPAVLESGIFSSAKDVQVAVDGLSFCRELGNSSHLAPFDGGEVLPASAAGDLAGYARDGCQSFHHPIGTAKMGEGELAVVDSELRVRGIGRLRIADASVLPFLPVGGIMAPCVAIGERAADRLKADHFAGGS